jgi:3-deoxy-7-phosphoheptulonate synthase
MQHQPLTHNIRVKSFKELISPQKIKERLPCPEEIEQQVFHHRQAIQKCLRGEDPRLMVIVGPCSIHDPEAGLEYAERLAGLARKVEDRMLIIMRVYFEKPRTTIGWKGFISDPWLDGSNDVESGLIKARELLLEVASLGLPAATEFLDPIVPQYTTDLISWAAIGARTTESQTHREMASGLSMPVGFKNATSGSLQIALDAVASARASHSFIGIDEAGQTAIVTTTGNSDAHIILRGGDRPNYHREDIQRAQEKLGALPGSADSRMIIVDCSHGNSNKDYTLQPIVFHNVVDQYVAGSKVILGLMLESFLTEGKQIFPSSTPLIYGTSITDACISWEMTEETLLAAYVKLLKS